MNPLNLKNYLPSVDGKPRKEANIICSSIVVDNLVVGVRIHIHRSDVSNLDIFLN